MVQVYIYILNYALSTLLQNQRTLSCPSRPPQIPPDISPSIHTTPPPLHLTLAAHPIERVPLTLCRMSISTWTNLIHQTYSSCLFYFLNHITVFPQRHPLSLSLPQPPPSFTMNFHPDSVFHTVLHNKYEYISFILASVYLYSEAA